MLHIVFGEADVDTLQKAIALDTSLQGEIYQIKDDFVVGPIENIYETEGYQQRRNWWKEQLRFSPYTEAIDIVDDKLTVHNIKRKLEEKEAVWVWLAPNAHDVCGYYWLISQLASFAGNVFIINIGNLPFINEKGSLFYPNYLFEIQPKEFLKAKKLARPITISEFELDGDEWKKLCNENALLRMFEGGKKAISKEASFYDDAIFNTLQKEPQKLSKFLSSFYTKTKSNVNDVFIAARIRSLTEEGKLIVTGNWSKGWKEVSVQLLSYQQTELPVA